MSSPQVLSTGAHTSSYALGNQHTVMLHDFGQCVGIGSDKKGQIRGVSALRNVKAVYCTWNGTYVVVEDCKGVRLLSNGSNSKGQLGRSLTNRAHVRMISLQSTFPRRADSCSVSLVEVNMFWFFLQIAQPGMEKSGGGGGMNTGI